MCIPHPSVPWLRLYSSDLRRLLIYHFDMTGALICQSFEEALGSLCRGLGEMAKVCHVVVILLVVLGARWHFQLVGRWWLLGGIVFHVGLLWTHDVQVGVLLLVCDHGVARCCGWVHALVQFWLESTVEDRLSGLDGQLILVWTFDLIVSTS